MIKVLLGLGVLGILAYNFPFLWWVFGSIFVIILVIAVIFILGISGAGTGESMGQVAKRFFREWRTGKEELSEPPQEFLDKLKSFGIHLPKKRK